MYIAHRRSLTEEFGGIARDEAHASENATAEKQTEKLRRDF
jgi:hypothetical protein